MQTANRTSADIISHLELEGYCIIDEVIPSNEVAGVRDNVFAAFEAQSAAAAAHAHKVRGQGHRLGGAGVQAVTGLLNLDQSVAPYLADDRIISAVEGLFGPYCRITNVSAMVNNAGNDRGYWHSDWPYNQTNASHIPAPYADQPIKLSSIWMLTEFSPHTGGTLVIPGSQKMRTNPSGGDCHDREAPHAAEMQISGAPGSVMLFDSRLWHSVTTNNSDGPRIALNVGYAPWWLNVQPTIEGTADFERMVVEPQGKPNINPPLDRAVFETLPAAVKPLFRHSVSL